MDRGVASPSLVLRITEVTSDELGLAFGRQTVIHGALASGGLTQRVVEEANRLRGVRENEGGSGRLEG
jgi:hypothetical protein